MKYTQLDTDAFKEIQLNAGILCTSFTPASGAATGIMGATTGGVNFTDVPSFVDFGDDIDNCPKNTMELKRIDGREIKISGNFVTIDADLVKALIGTADADSTDATKIIPRDEIKTTDFKEIWWVGDYSDKNGDNGGYVAIHMLHALNTSGFAIQSSDKAKGQFAFEFTAHYSIESQNTVPYEVYIKAGT